MSKKPSTSQRLTDPRRTYDHRGPFTPQPAGDELRIPLPTSLERYRDNLLTVLFDGSLTPADQRHLKRSARRDSLCRSFSKVSGDPVYVTSPTIRQLRSQAIVDSALNARNALADRTQLATAIDMREQELATLTASPSGNPADTDAADALSVAARHTDDPDYKVRRAARQARAAAAKAAHDAAARTAQRTAMIEQLTQELTELRRLDEQLHVDAILSTIAARYENQARFYLTKAHLPRELRTLEPEPLTARDIYRALVSGFDGAWVGIPLSFGTAEDAFAMPDARVQAVPSAVPAAAA